MEIKIEIPMLPPTVNHSHVYTRRGVFKSSEYVKWERAVKLFIGSHGPLAEEPLSVRIEFYTSWFTKKGKMRRRDVDNLAKATLDAVFKCLGINDCSVFSLHLVKRESIQDKTVVIIQSLMEN